MRLEVAVEDVPRMHAPQRLGHVERCEQHAAQRVDLAATLAVCGRGRQVHSSRRRPLEVVAEGPCMCRRRVMLLNGGPCRCRCRRRRCRTAPPALWQMREPFQQATQ